MQGEKRKEAVTCSENGEKRKKKDIKIAHANKICT